MKAILFILLSCCMTHSFAKQIQIKHDKQDPIAWKIETKDDGMLFILGPESEYSLFIKVDQFLQNGDIPDPITVYCNNSIYRLAPHESMMCYGNINDMSSFSIALNNFNKGSQGTYQYIPIKTKL